MPNKFVAIVDAFSTGRLVAEHWATTHKIIHIQSSPDMPQAFVNSAPSDLFFTDIKYTGNEAALLNLVSAYAVEHVVCGSEFGVELTDKLAYLLNLPGNNYLTSQVRRDKYAMGNILADNGLAIGQQFICNSSLEVDRYFGEFNGKKVVVKPLNSAGSEDVFICQNVDEAIEAANEILGKTNLMQKTNEYLVLQEFLEGHEFIVNSVSLNGVHYVSDVWKSYKSKSADGRLIYDYEVLLRSQDTETKDIVDYTSAALTSLGIDIGPAHSELILTPQGPRLLETGARVSGLANPNALNLATGHNQVALSVNCYRNPARIEALKNTQYERLKASYCVNLISPCDGLVDEQALTWLCESLPSFESLRLRCTQQQVSETVDLNSSPGVIFLVHESEDQVRQDYLKIRAAEQTLYNPIQSQN